MDKKITLLSALLLASSVQAQNAQTDFLWETAVKNQDKTVLETEDGITVTVTDLSNSVNVSSCRNCLGTNGKFISSNSSEVLFTFSEPVFINSIFTTLEDKSLNREEDFSRRSEENLNSGSVFTFEANEDFKSVTLNGPSLVTLNWKQVTSLIVKSENTPFGFDDLRINGIIPSTVTKVSDDTGISDTDRVTSDQTLKIYGKAEPYHNVDVILDENKIGEAQSNDQGEWVFDYTGVTLAEGEYLYPLN